MEFVGLYRKQAVIREKYRLFEPQELTPQQQINIMRALNGAHPLSLAQMVRRAGARVPRRQDAESDKLVQCTALTKL